jgi:hypothetical protein
VKSAFLFLFLSLSLHVVVAQDEYDSTAVVVEEEYVQTDSIAAILDDDDINPMHGTNDSLVINERDFSAAELEELKKEIHYQFQKPPTFGQTLWEQILRWIAEFFGSLWNVSTDTNWGKLFTYLMTLAVVVLVIFVMLKLNAYKIFYSGQGVPMKYSEVDEDIHQIDFEREIQLAIKEQNYRRGIRLLFLFSLKKLSDKQHIVWEQGKTNHEYVNELRVPELKEPFSQLSYYFDYAWYGNFDVNRDLFERVNNIFNHLKGKVK